MPDALTLDRFNSAPPGALRDALRACITSTAWADRVLAGRPYADADALAAAAETAVLDLAPAEIDAALAGHPRIGEPPVRAHADAGSADGAESSAGGTSIGAESSAGGTSTGAAFSRREQAGVVAGAETAARLAERNAAYERRFGHVFLIRAAGRDAAGVLAELERRMGNDPAAERAEATGQLAEITALRLREVLAR